MKTTFYILSIILIFIGCTQHVCLEDYIVFQDFKKSPSIAIVAKKNETDCIYDIKYSFCIDGILYNSPGELYIEDSVMYLKFNEPETGFFKFFDFRINKGEVYRTSLQNKTDSNFFTIILEGKIPWNNESVYIFKVLNAFCLDGRSYNIVFLTTINLGVIGSYYTENDTNDKVVISPKGNILKELIDYSDYSFRVFR